MPSKTILEVPQYSLLEKPGFFWNQRATFCRMGTLIVLNLPNRKIEINNSTV